MFDKNLGIDIYYLYCLIAENNIAKFGISENYKTRVQTIKTACPLNITSVKIVKFSLLEEARSFEKSIHNQFAAFRLNGEWFKFPDWINIKNITDLPVSLPDYLEPITITFLEAK